MSALGIHRDATAAPATNSADDNAIPAMFVAGAAVASRWIPNALTQTLLAFAAGCLLGLVGLTLSRWEFAGGLLHYTPNRWLVLGLLVLVAARIGYGFWRTWHAWHTTGPDTSWLAAAGVAGSLGAGAVVLGYYLSYWLGVRRRLKAHARR